MVRPSSPVASRRIVCFSHKTALEILTALPPSQKPQPMRSRKFPDQAPSLKDAQLASDRILEQCPALSLSRPLHVTSASTSHNHRTDVVEFHRSGKPFGGTGLLSLGEGTRVTSVPFTFVQMATSLSLIELLELGYELCGTYRRGKAGEPTRYHADPLMTTRQLAQFLRMNPGMHGAKRAQRALSYIAKGAESPREAKCALLFGLPVALGGYGLGIPLMGYEVECTGEGLCYRRNTNAAMRPVLAISSFGHGVPKQGFSRGGIAPCSRLAPRECVASHGHRRGASHRQRA